MTGSLDARCIRIIEPFGNRLRFHEARKSAPMR